MDYGQIIKRSWEIVKKNRFLWWLGILAAFAGGFGVPSFNFSFPSGLGSPSQDSSGTKLQSAELAKQLSEIPSHVNIPLIIGATVAIGILMLIIYFVLIYFSIKAKAGLIISVDKIENENVSIGFRGAMREGGKYFWRIFGLVWLAGLIILGLMLLIMSPLLILFFSHQIALIVGLVLFEVTGFIVFLLFCFLFSLILLLAQIMIVLENKKVFESVKESYKLIRRNLKEMAIGFAITIGMGMLIGLAVVILMIAAILIGTVIGGISYLVGGMVAVAISTVIVVIVGIIVFVILMGFVTAFTSAYWTLFYRALKFIDSKKINS